MTNPNNPITREEAQGWLDDRTSPDWDSITVSECLRTIIALYDRLKRRQEFQDSTNTKLYEAWAEIERLRAELTPKGDGITDDTAAIQRITDQAR